jgi:hypothetical protein
MKSLPMIAAALLLALPVVGHTAATPANPAAASLPKGHPSLPAPEATATLSGKILKTMDSGGYTYIYLQQDKGNKVWAAVPQTKVSVGKKVNLVPGEEFTNFTSKTLNRSFDKLIFSAGVIPLKGAKNEPAAVIATGSKAAAAPAEKIVMGRAVGANTYTVAELYAQKGKLSGKQVIVRGKVVKVSPRIMKRNWVHIQDGTGSAGKKNHDLVVTTMALPADGQTVTVSGILLKDRDFGSGYKYEVLIENAEITK